MRAQLVQALTQQLGKKNTVFLTGDLGFGFFEILRKKAGPRFLNMGVAEQSMISFAAGLARAGLSPWAYSIGPFIYARALEQIRNDLCFNSLPVKLIGNGGGFCYGHSGPEHHSVEDYGILSTLNSIKIYIPNHADDLSHIIPEMNALKGPSYLRLARSSENAPSSTKTPFTPWREHLSGNLGILLIIGPLVWNYVKYFNQASPNNRPEIWSLSQLPMDPQNIPQKLLEKLIETSHLTVVEEHVQSGSVGEKIGTILLQKKIHLKSYRHHFIKDFPSVTYGSENYHRKQNFLLPEQVYYDRSHT